MPEPYGRSTSPDGRWFSRRMTEPTPVAADDPDNDVESAETWRSQLRVESADGSRSWVAHDEVMGLGICPNDKDALGWSADGRSFYFAGLGCGEGCVRFGGPTDLWRLDLASGEVEVVLGEGDRATEVTLSPDGQFAAFFGGEGLAWLDLSTGERKSVEIPALPYQSMEEISEGGIVWSPAGDKFALARLVGRCPDEMWGAVIVVDKRAREATAFGAPGDAPLVPASWDDDGRLRLRTVIAGEGRQAHWLLDLATGRFVEVGGDPPLVEREGTLSESPDGRWAARVMIEPTPASEEEAADTWRSQLRVEAADGTASWVASDDRLGLDMGIAEKAPLGWSEDGLSFFFTARGGTEGCGRFGSPYDLWRLDLASGVVEAMLDHASQVTLAPGGRRVAWFGVGRRFTWRDLATGEEQAIREVTNGGAYGPAIGGLVWSPDQDRLAMASLQGPCSEETVSETLVVDLTTGQVSTYGPPDGLILVPDAWTEPDRLRLTDEKIYNSALPREGWLLDLATGAFSKAEAP